MLGAARRSSPERSLVLIAGAGVAALEAMLALDNLAGERVRMELLAPTSEFVYRPLLVAAPFADEPPVRVPLGTLLAGKPVEHLEDGLAEVVPAAGAVRTTRGAERRFDALLIALGARPVEALAGALTFSGPADVEAYRALLRALEDGAVERLLFVVPPACGWALPLYELALLTAAHAFERRLAVELAFATHEPSALAAFGQHASRDVTTLLERHGIALRTGVSAVAAGERGVTLADGASIAADRVVALPRLEGPRLPGLPHDDDGFIPIDEHARVIGRERVYAAGDATTLPLKQGGLATQQADAAAAAIAADAGAPITPAPFRPVLRGLLLTGGEPLYLRSQAGGGAQERSLSGREPIWWPAGKIAGRYLTTYLAERAAVEVPEYVRRLAESVAARA
jgi:sulfide:quinone oxidoreductase